MDVRMLAMILAAACCLQAKAQDQETSDSGSNCYSLSNLMHDLRYGHCWRLQDIRGKRGGPAICPELSQSLNRTPQFVISEILDESSDPEPFGEIMSCKYVAPFVHQGINRVQRGSGSLLHESALACDKDRIIFLRVLGAKQVKDTKGHTPEQALDRLIDHLKLSIRLESDAKKVKDIQKRLDKCNAAMTAMQTKKLSVGDLKSVGIPLESKITLVEFGKAHGTVADEATVVQTDGDR